FLPTCGAMIWTVDLLFVVRSTLQGMGKPFIPMLSGILEMVLRVSVIILFSGSVGFISTAYAEICAWTGAMLLNLVALYVQLRAKLPGRVHNLIRVRRGVGM
ncbi:MAG: MATE family efflux transporter, partial [Eubacterium sp.]|nr:MATE family efflux transporter [Eubacterium sp.]